MTTLATATDDDGARDRGVPKLVRVVPSELDLALHSPSERRLLRLAQRSQQLARRLGRTGIFMLGAAVLTSMVPLVYLVAAPLAVIGAGLLVVGGLAWFLSVGSRLPALLLELLRRFRKAPPTEGEGSMVTIVGRVRALRTLPALDGQPVVFSFVRATREGRGAHVYRAEDFLLEAQPGVTIHVEVTGAELLERPAGAFPGRPGLPAKVIDLLPLREGPIDVGEATLSHGDLVAVTGVLEERVDPAGERAGARETPIMRVLRGTSTVPLCVRRAPSTPDS